VEPVPDEDRDDRNDRYRKYIDAASVLGQITRARAEEMVRDMLSGSEEQRAHVQQRMDDLIDRSRRMTEGLIDLVRGEVTHQLRELGLDPEELARQAADILRKYAGAPVSRRRGRGRGTAPAGTASPPGTKGGPAAAKPAKRAAGKKAPGKKAAGKKAAAETSGTRKASAKTAAAKTAAANKTAPAKKTAAARVTAKKGAKRAAESTR
jgi:hypothetical protein